MLKNRGALVAKALAGEDTGPATFDLDSMRKGLRTMLEQASGLGVELPTAARVLEAFDRTSRAGHGGIDGVRIRKRCRSTDLIRNTSKCRES